MDDWWSDALKSASGAEGPPPPLMPLRRRGWRSKIQTWHIAIGGAVLFAAGLIVATSLSRGPSNAARETADASKAAATQPPAPVSPQPPSAANPSPASGGTLAGAVAVQSPSPPPDSPPAAASPPAPAGPPVKADATGASHENSGFQYPWKVGKVYECQFRLEATVAGTTPTFVGTVTYEPSGMDPGPLTGEDADQEATGTAFVVEPSGFLVTCAHCVRGATQIEIVLEKKTYPAKVTAYDPQHDLALLKIEAASLPPLGLQELDQVELAQEVWALGYPLSDQLGESLKITRGTVAGVVDRKGRKVFQIDATLNPGNSGGPVVDTQGRVIGIVRSGLVGEAIERVEFAVPASEALQLLHQQGIHVAPAADGTAMDGPALARRVRPSVAYLKVHIGPGGVGVAERRLVRYSGSISANLPAAPAPGRSRSARPRSRAGSWSTAMGRSTPSRARPCCRS